MIVLSNVQLKLRILRSAPTESRFAFEWSNPVMEWTGTMCILSNTLLWYFDWVFPFSSSTPSFVRLKMLGVLCVDPRGCPCLFLCFFNVFLLLLLLFFHTTESERYLGYNSTDSKDLCSILVYIQYVLDVPVYMCTYTHYAAHHTVLWLCSQLHLSHLFIASLNHYSIIPLIPAFMSWLILSESPLMLTCLCSLVFP